MSKHTPGPWETSGAIIQLRIRSETGSVIGDANYINPDAEANARLIAAAPDLYEALYRIIQTIGPPSGMEAAWNAAEEAIKKATGQ